MKLSMDQSAVSIILVGPQGDANIGAAARAMKNFGITDLRLVDPVPYLTRPAYMWAVEAKDVLESARCFDALPEALADGCCAAAFTRRTGSRRRRHLLLHEAAPLLAERAATGGVALVFGREDKGLSNAEARRCDYVVEIPTSAMLPSLNLAQSVLLACYELSRARQALSSAPPSDAAKGEERFVPRGEIARTLALLESMLLQLGYEDEPGTMLRSRILQQFERIFGRGGLTSRDVGMVEGLASRIAVLTSSR